MVPFSPEPKQFKCLVHLSSCLLRNFCSSAGLKIQFWKDKALIVLRLFKIIRHEHTLTQHFTVLAGNNVVSWAAVLDVRYVCSCISGCFSNAIRRLKVFFYTMGAKQPTLRARTRLNLGMEFRLGDCCIEGMLPSDNKGEQQTSGCIISCRMGEKSSSSVK